MQEALGGGWLEPLGGGSVEQESPTERTLKEVKGCSPLTLNKVEEQEFLRLGGQDLAFQEPSVTKPRGHQLSAGCRKVVAA